MLRMRASTSAFAIYFSFSLEKTEWGASPQTRHWGIQRSIVAVFTFCEVQASGFFVYGSDARLPLALPLGRRLEENFAMEIKMLGWS